MANFVYTPRAAASSTFHKLLIEKRRDQKLPELLKLSSRTPKLQLSITQNLALPDISRMHTPKLRKISPIVANPSGHPIEKQLINLERLIL